MDEFASPSFMLQETTPWGMRAVQRGGVQYRVLRKYCCLSSACWLVIIISWQLEGDLKMSNVHPDVCSEWFLRDTLVQQSCTLWAWCTYNKIWLCAKMSQFMWTFFLFLLILLIFGSGAVPWFDARKVDFGSMPQ